MQPERQHSTTRQPAPKPYPTTPAGGDDARARAAGLVQSADALIDRILSEDSSAFLDANRQTGGE